MYPKQIAINEARSMLNFRGLLLPRGVLTRTSHITSSLYHFTDEKSIPWGLELKGKKWSDCLHQAWLCRIVLLTMKIKQKVSTFFVSVLMMLSLFVLPVLISSDAHAASTGATSGTGAGGAPTSLSGGNDCGGVDTAIIKCSAKNSGDVTDNGIWALLLLIINIMTAGVGVLAVAGIVYGAVLYTTAEDKADQVKKATDVLTNVVIGLIAFALMWAALNFIIPGGVFKP